MHIWFELKLLSLRLRIFSVKLTLRQVVGVGKGRWRKKVTKARDKARMSKRKAARIAKDIIIPSLPGVSKLKLPQPPVPHLLRSNLPPSDSERDLIKKTIADAGNTVSNLKQKLATRIEAGQTNRGWETVTRHKIGQATRFINQHEGIISSIRRLPIELIQEIFAWATLHVRTHSRYRTVSELPWRLSQVCQTWRASALSVSTLWSFLPTLQLKKSRAATRHQMGYLTELLRRSGKAPLDIYVHSPYYDNKTHPILDTLISHSERWQTLTVEATPILISGFGAAKGRLSSLKCLALQTPWHRFFDGPPVALDTFEVAPQLQKVSVSGPFAGEVKLPFSQLVHYKERRISSNLMNQVLSSSLLQSLTVLELSDQADFPSVTLPHLIKLQIKFQHEAMGNAFDKFTLPAIEDIKAVSAVGNLIARLTTLIGRSRSPCPLKTLSVRTGFIEPGDLSSLLRLTPELRSLDTTITRTNNFIDIASLAYRGRSPPLVPYWRRALNELAALRCELEIEGDTTTDVTLVPGEIRPLKHLCIYFDAAVQLQRQQAELEGWSSSAVSMQMGVFKAQLIIEIPNLAQGGVAKLGAREKPLSKKGLERVSTLLKDIDSTVIEDPVNIYAAGIHYTLHDFSQMRYAPNSEESRLCKRAKDILEKWHPLFLEDLPHRHWAFKGSLCVGYVPTNDDIRTSGDALDIIYGLQDEMPLHSIFWPTFMSYS
ncbi:hypothetical protein BJ912DRAFT_955651 [Pholiota molesta]|nr:hypothetical protein BJ912DRAFT_955651 [Pholiota molesta]